jgi:heterodisulfide reductase subunit A2
MTQTGKRAMIIGGGLAGMEAALRIGQAGFEALLVEKEAVLGGTVLKLCSSFPRWEDPLELVEERISQLKRRPQVTVMTETRVTESRPRQKGFSVSLKVENGDVRQLDVDAVVLATGFDMMDVSVYGEYGYGIYEEVINSLEFEARIKAWRNGSTEKAPRGVAFFKCVGSRDRSKGYPYCSKICCMYTAKQAGEVKDMFPEAKVYVFYMDYRASGKGYEEFVREVIEQKHVRYVRGRPAKVLPDGGRLLVRAEDTLIGVPIEVSVDLVVLASAAVPRRETGPLAAMFGAKTDEYGFLEKERFSLTKASDRVFFAGGCGFPLDIPSAQQQGAAAAAEVIESFGRE